MQTNFCLTNKVPTYKLMCTIFVLPQSFYKRFLLPCRYVIMKNKFRVENSAASRKYVALHCELSHNTLEHLHSV